jgi:hypothetical protein
MKADGMVERGRYQGSGFGAVASQAGAALGVLGLSAYAYASGDHRRGVWA